MNALAKRQSDRGTAVEAWHEAIAAGDTFRFAKTAPPTKPWAMAKSL